MKGMRTKGTDLDTNFGPLAASKELRPLARLQRMADKEIPTEPAKILLDGEDFYLVGIDSTHVYVTTTPTPEPFPKNMPLHVGQLPSKELSDDVHQWLGGNSSALKAEYKRTAAKKTASDGNTPSILKKDGEVKFTGTHNECLDWLHKNTSYSWDHAMKHEGWTIEPVTESKKQAAAWKGEQFEVDGLMMTPTDAIKYVRDHTETAETKFEVDGVHLSKDEALRQFKEALGKKAAIYDGYGVRVTIETKAGDTNESYTMVTSMLQEADIRYREVRRYTVDPDRVLLEVLVRKQDTEIIKELAKAAEKEGVLITMNDTISEGLYPKRIVRMSKKEEASVKAAAAPQTSNEWGDLYIEVSYMLGDISEAWDKINQGEGDLAVPTWGKNISPDKMEGLYRALNELKLDLERARTAVGRLGRAVHDSTQQPSQGVAGSKEVLAKAPPGWERAVEKMKKDPDIDNPFAIAWDAYNKGHAAPKD